MEQVFGEGRKAKFLGKRFSAEADEITFDLSPAYPGFKDGTAVRTFRYDRANGAITITDVIRCEKPEQMEFPVMTEAPITPGGEKGAWLLKAGGKVLRLTVAAEGAGAWSFKREDIERTVGGHAVTRLALTLDEPAKSVKVTTVFRPETAP